MGIALSRFVLRNINKNMQRRRVTFWQTLTLDCLPMINYQVQSQVHILWTLEMLFPCDCCHGNRHAAHVLAKTCTCPLYDSLLRKLNNQVTWQQTFLSTFSSSRSTDRKMVWYFSEHVRSVELWASKVWQEHLSEGADRKQADKQHLVSNQCKYIHAC